MVGVSSRGLFLDLLFRRISSEVLSRVMRVMFNMSGVMRRSYSTSMLRGGSPVLFDAMLFGTEDETNRKSFREVCMVGVVLEKCTKQHRNPILVHL